MESEKGFMPVELDNYDLSNNIIEKENKDIIIKNDNIIYQFTSTNNQNSNNESNNISTINLGMCETKLKLYYNISNNIPLLILKMDVYEEGLLIPIIEYEVYNIKTKDKLDLDICKDIKIDINIPIDVNENNLFKHNSSDKYYNDICYTYISSDGTDI